MDNEKWTACQTCGAEIAADAKTCPHCGAKNKVKKPVYKRWWFWALIVVIIIVMLPDTRTETQEPEKPTQNVAEQTQAPVQSETSEPSGEEGSSLPVWTTAQKNVMAKAKAYLDYTAFSYTGLIRQLEYEKFTNEEAVWAADNCNADWNEQAVRKAKDYLDYSAFSRQGLIDQLLYEGFTQEQAEYGVSQNGY